MDCDSGVLRILNPLSSPPQGRAPFVVPDKVPWSRLGEVLSMKFKSYVGRDLNPESLHFLAGKAFRNPNMPDYTNMLLSWSQFCKEALPNNGFTFWEWFFAILKVTREHLRSLWNDGTVMGFVGKKTAEGKRTRNCGRGPLTNLRMHL